MKQTAVEWLTNEIENISVQVFDGFLTFIEFMEEREKLCKQAKEMEKQQLIDAIKSTDYIIGATDKEWEEFAQQYYNETFKSE